MSFLLFLLVIATAINGMLGGASLEAALVKLPARQRIGALAYATFARGNDLGNGLVVYPIWAVSAAVLVFLVTALALVEGDPSTVLVPLAIATTTSVIHFIFTSRAAPVMLSLRNASNDENELKQKLDRFAFWHAFRAAFQVLTFFVLLWALVAFQR